MDGQKDRWMDRRTDGWAEGQTDGQKDRRMDRRTDGWTGGQRDGQEDRRKDGYEEPLFAVLRTRLNGQ
jgi:hypothetical protein